MSESASPIHRAVARALRKRTDPHGKPIVDSSILKGVEIDESGIVELWIKPNHPHCPCCLDIHLHVWGPRAGIIKKVAEVMSKKLGPGTLIIGSGVNIRVGWCPP